MWQRSCLFFFGFTELNWNSLKLSVAMQQKIGFTISGNVLTAVADYRAPSGDLKNIKRGGMIMSTCISSIKNVNFLRRSGLFFSVLFCANMPMVFAQDRSETVHRSDINREISRDAVELADLIRPQPVPDPDILETAIVFTNVINRAAKVICVAHDQNGQPVGHVTVRIPPQGLRFVRGSDLSDGKDFIGHAKCKGEGALRISGFLISNGLTDLPVNQSFERIKLQQATTNEATDGPIVSTMAHISVVVSF